jgi:plastocyanin
MAHLARSILVMLVAIGCAGDDAPARPDAEPQPRDVVEVDCATATIAATVSTAVNAYDPDTTTISVGQVVRFNPAASHDVSNADFRVPFGGNRCFRFDAAASYTIVCTAHGFTGTVVVTP